ncbi:MAG: VWA domain-containing protein, partial [Burkholderiales bacterium]
AALLAAAAPAGAPGASVYDSAAATAACLRVLGVASRAERAAADDDDADTPAAEGPPRKGSGGGDDAGDEGDTLPDPDAFFEGDAVDFRGDVRPELVQRQLRGGHTGLLPDAQAPETAADADTPPETPAQAERRRQSDESALRRAFGLSKDATRSWLYDEWDYHRQGYLKGWCRLHEYRLRGDDASLPEQLRRRHGPLLSEVQRQFRHIRPDAFVRVRRVSDGEEIELDGLIEAAVDRRAGHATDEHVYRRRDRALREVSAAFLLDMSASTDFPVPDPDAPPPPPEPPPPPDGEYVWGNWSARDPLLPDPPKRRVIDVAREALALMAQALETLGDRYAIWGFSGYGRDDVEFHVAKDFDDRLRAPQWAALAAMQPRRSTRMGPAIRHAVARLRGQPTRLKLLVMISDGYPQDRDYGPDRDDDEYGIQDTAQALREAQQAGVLSFCITVDPAGHDYLRRMCPDDRYLVIDEVAALPRELAKVYRALTP